MSKPRVSDCDLAMIRLDVLLESADKHLYGSEYYRDRTKVMHDLFNAVCEIRDMLKLDGRKEDGR